MKPKTRKNEVFRSVLIALAFLLSGLFFLFFGNGAAENRSLFPWILHHFKGDSFWLLIFTGGLAIWLLSKKNRSLLLAGNISLRGGIALLSGLISLAVTAYILGRPAVSFVCFNALIFGIISSFYGRGAHAFLFLFLFSLFTLPHTPLASLTPIIQMGASYTSNLLMSWCNIDFFSQGTTVLVHGFKYIIAPECSGLRGIELSMRIAFLIAALYPINWIGKTILFSGLFILSAACNIIRIGVVIALGIWKGEKVALSLGHEIIGPIISILILLFSFYFAATTLVRCFPRKRSACSEKKSLQTVHLTFLSLLILLTLGAALSLWVGPKETTEPFSFSKRLQEIQSIDQWKRTDGLFCTTNNCLFSFSTIECPLYRTATLPCGQNKDSLPQAEPYSLTENTTENLRVYRALYQANKNRPFIKLTVADGGRTGLNECQPYWHLRIFGANIENRKTISLLLDDGRNVQVTAIDFLLPIGHGYYMNTTGIYWFTNQNRIYPSNLRMNLDLFRPHHRTAGFAYCQKSEKKELVDFVRQLLSKTL